MPIGVAAVGAGSIGFTRRQVQDILGVPELQDIEFAFTDINERNLATGITHIRLGTSLGGWTVRDSEPHLAIWAAETCPSGRGNRQR